MVSDKLKDELNMITIPTRVYDSLMEDSIKLSYLESWGVDNWSGYEEAMDEYRAELEEAINKSKRN